MQVLKIVTMYIVCSLCMIGDRSTFPIIEAMHTAIHRRRENIDADMFVCNHLMEDSPACIS
jgi:hypothetical protein